MKTEHIELLDRLEACVLDDSAAAFPFSRRLARDNGWTPTYVQRVVREYKRFAFLAIAAGHPVTPSDQVDQVWHLHLLYTQSYWKEFCGDVLRQPLQHGPTKGGGSEREKFNDWYGRTLASYRAFFGEEPPPDIWPAPAQRFSDDIHFARVNTAWNWVVPKPEWMRKAARVFSNARRRLPLFPVSPVFQPASSPTGTSALPAPQTTGSARPRSQIAWPSLHLVIAAMASLALVGWSTNGKFVLASTWPFDLTAEPFLVLFFLVCAGVFSLAWRLRWRARLPIEEPNTPLPELDAYETAFLAAGKNRAMLAAVGSLADRGALRLDEKEHRLRRDVRSGNAHPFEAAVHDAASVDPGSTFAELSAKCSVSSAFAPIEDRLRQLGLLPTGDQGLHACLWPTLIALLAPVMAITRIVLGISRDKPVGILIFAFVVSLAISLSFAVRPHRTRRGDAVLARLKEKYAEMETRSHLGEQSFDPLVLPLAVGLFGTGVLANTRLANLEKKLQTSDGCGGGGCGGGCGGGGCGGCGGCG